MHLPVRDHTVHQSTLLREASFPVEQFYPCKDSNGLQLKNLAT